MSSRNLKSISHNKTLPFCIGAVIYGVIPPFLVGLSPTISPLCEYILGTNPGVNYVTLHTYSESNKEFGLHIIPKTIFK